MTKAITAAVLKKLRLVLELDDDDIREIESLPITVRDIGAHEYVIRNGERPTHCCAVAEGFLIRAKYGSTGKRQLLSLHIPGDIPDLHSLQLNVMDHDLMTLSRCTVGFIPHMALHELGQRRPHIGEALWREALIDASVLREWIFNVGQRQALARMAHLFLEMKHRLDLIGRCKNSTFDLPMTQNEYGDALGLTSIHVNRVMQELRREGLVSVNRHSVTIIDEPRLKELAGFDKVYLHQQGPEDSQPPVRAMTSHAVSLQ